MSKSSRNFRKATISSRRSFRVESEERDSLSRVKKGQLHSNEEFDSKVGVSVGVTIGLPGFSSARVEVSLSHPVGKKLNKTEISKTYSSVLEQVLAELEGQVNEVLGSDSLRKIRDMGERR